jgi:hypothetical protein
MTSLAEEDEEAYALQFSVAKAAGFTGDKVEALWQSVHEKIRAATGDELLKTSLCEKMCGYFKVRKEAKPTEIVKKSFKKQKMSKQLRIARVAQRLAVRDARIAALKASKQ